MNTILFIYEKKKYRYTTEEFIEIAREIHGDKYDYSKVEYVNAHTKVCIICPKHGEFWQMPYCHLNGSGCPKCNSSKLEKSLREYLNDKNIKFEEQKTFDWLKYKSNMFLDFYLSDYNIGLNVKVDNILFLLIMLVWEKIGQKNNC